MNFFQNKRVLVTGGAGFIGSHLVEALVESGAKVRVPSRKKDTPFLSAVKAKIELIQADLKSPAISKNLTKNIDLVFHLAAHVAGIDYNQAHPATLLYENLLPMLNVIEATKQARLERLLIVSSACVYPRFCTIPTPEIEGFKDEPEPTNYGYGWSKRISEILAKTYAEEFRLKIGVVRPYNVYGPRDNFDPKTSHVTPALVKKVCDGQDPLIVWGDGSATRSFLYVTDVVKGMMLAMAKYPHPDPINLGTKKEIKIKDLARLIIKLSGKKTRIEFDRTKPNGQPRRNCDTKKAKKILGWQARVSLKQGLAKVIKYYRDYVQSQD